VCVCVTYGNASRSIAIGCELIETDRIGVRWPWRIVGGTVLTVRTHTELMQQRVVTIEQEGFHFDASIVEQRNVDLQRSHNPINQPQANHLFQYWSGVEWMHALYL
jgi:hypothetical protein